MPRDFLADKTLESMPQLSRELPAASPPPEQRKANPYGTSLVRVEDPFKKIANNKIHPFSSLLSVDDLDDCDWLEHAAFDAIEAASREKVSRSHLSSSFKVQISCRLLALHLCINFGRFSHLRSFPCVVLHLTTTSLMRVRALACP